MRECRALWFRITIQGPVIQPLIVDSERDGDKREIKEDFTTALIRILQGY